MDTETTQPEFLTTKEAAVLLRVHPNTVMRGFANGTLPGFKVGDVWRSSRTALLNWPIERLRKLEAAS